VALPNVKTKEVFMTEMTNEPVVETNASATEVNAQNQTSESSTETHAENKAEVSDNAQKRINEITAEKYALKKEIEELKKAKEQPATENRSTTVDAPQLPDDVYDEDAMRKYHQDMLAYSAKQAQLAAQSTYKEQQTQAEQLAAQAKHSEVIQSYAKQGLKDGLTIDQMQINEQVLNGAGISNEIGNYLMQDSNGAKVANYLANNPDDLQKVVSMNPMQAAVFIANEVKLKALGPSNVSNAPEPMQTQTRGLASVTQDEFDERCSGAQFD
jgi:hypothetical protein